MRTLNLGMQGCEVGAWQQFLKTRSLYSGSISGRFDDATARATREYQHRSRLEEDGVAGPETIDRARRDGFIVPQGTGGGGDHFHLELGVDLSISGRHTMRKIAERYYMRTCWELSIHSGTQTPKGQAKAMWKNFYHHTNESTHYLNHEAYNEIYEAYITHRKAGADETTTVDAMTRVIERQVSEGIYISRHLRGEAVDILPQNNPGLQPNVLEEIVREVLGSGHFLPEQDHFYIQF